MKISIIIPIYNVSEWVEDCLSSVAQQTYSSIECIIINDCSPDDSMEKVYHFIKNNSGKVEFKIVNHTENKGLSAARNTGIKNASGDYLFFLDSDDEIFPDTIMKMVNLVNKYHSDFVIGDFEIKSNDCILSEVALKKNVCINKEYLSSNREISCAYFREQWFVMACNKLIKKELFEIFDLYFPIGLLHEDLLWSFKLAGCASNMSVCKDNTYIYKLHNNSISGQIKQKNIDDFLKILRMCDLIVLSYPYNKYLKAKLHSIANYIIRNILKSSISREEKINTIRSLKYYISRKNRFCYPLSISDLLKMILFNMPSTVIYYLVQLYNKR